MEKPHFRTVRSYFRAALPVIAMVALSLCPPALADNVILDDLIVDGSACIGFDCVNGESFGLDTIRLKEHKLRIDFKDTSNTASFPDRDWRIVIKEHGGLASAREAGGVRYR